MPGWRVARTSSHPRRAAAGVIRRKARDIEQIAGTSLSMVELLRRGLRLAEISGQFVIFRNRAPILTLASAAEDKQQRI